eukprot:TRINITY_DN985_c0_g2_i1.p1 TRINITY_DN985_c0_g2~~TRINITY_DN985_c0_g2_i1.p1  ORF type:complete len:1226 (+),score=563.45 TRINITY_DN985_c0_g2_i1:55-3678(+)
MAKQDDQKELKLLRRHAFGIKADVKDNIHFIDDSTCAYPVGRNVVIYHTQGASPPNQQRFIQGNERCEAITAMALSPNKRYLAVAESAESPTISIYDVAGGNRKKRKTLPGQGQPFPELNSREYVCMAFSADGKVLVTQGGAPEWSLVYWSWDRSKAVAWVSSATDKTAAAQDKHHITAVSVSPKDSTLLCVSGNGVFRFFRLQEGQLKPAPGGMGKRDPQNFLCHCWLPPDDRIVVSTDSGDLLLVENSEFKCVLQGSPSEGLSIDALISYAKGFICGGDMGLVFIFERSDDKELYRKMKAMKVDQKREADGTMEADTMRVKSFALTQQEEFLALTTSNNQIYLLNLSNADFAKGEDAVFEPLAQWFHSAPIIGLDTCVRKPLVATCSKDRSIRVWNYVDHTLEMAKTFHTEATSIAMHPSGLHILVGFSDKLRFMNLYGDDIREFKSFPIRQCPECKFSSGGQYFAAVHGNVISIYNTYTCESMGHLRGHNGKVRSLFWMPPDDTCLLSVGMDGAIFDWLLKDSRKENEYSIKSAHYTSVTAGAPAQGSSASPFIWAVAADRKLREFEKANLQGGPLQEPDTGDYPLSTITFSPMHKLLLGGSEDGSVCAITVPLQTPIPPSASETVLAHAAQVNRIALTFDESVLFTAAEDCTLYVFDVKEREGRAKAREITFAEEILISKSDLEDKNNEISTQKAKVEELKVDMEYHAQKHNIKHVKEMKQMEDEHREQSQRQYQRFEQLLALKNEQEIEFTEIRRETAEKHRAELAKLEQDYQAQLQASEEQIAKLQIEIQEQNRDFLAQLQEKDALESQTKKEEEEKFRHALDAERETCAKLKDNEKLLRAKHEEIRQMMEQMTDEDIEEIKEKHERKLREAREQLLHLKGENGVMKKKFHTLNKDIKSKESAIADQFKEQSDKESRIKGLEKDIEALRNEIRERDDTIGDKEKRIYDLKKKNQELEKFKFVLDYKIRELKSQIEPRQDEIAAANLKIKEMDGELDRYYQNNAQLVLRINDLKLKIDGQCKEVGNLEGRLKDADAFRHRIRMEISELAAMAKEAKLLKEACKRLYHKHVRDENRRGPEIEEDVQKECNRQRDYLERTVESLKRKLIKDSDTHKSETTRIMNENVTLIVEINQLRREIKLLKSQQSRDRDLTSGAASTDEARREMDTNRREIGRLRERLEDLERQLHAVGRPPARERAPAAV